MALDFGKLLALTKTNVLCRSNDGKSSRVSLRHVGVPLLRMNTRIQSQCENETIICDRPKSNATVSIHNAEFYNIYVVVHMETHAVCKRTSPFANCLKSEPVCKRTRPYENREDARLRQYESRKST